MTSKKLLEKIRDKKASAREARQVLVRALFPIAVPKEKKTQVFDHIRSLPDDLLLEQAAGLVNDYFNLTKRIEEQQKPLRHLIASSVSKGMRSLNPMKQPGYQYVWLSVFANFALSNTYGHTDADDLRKALKESKTQKAAIVVMRELSLLIWRNLSWVRGDIFRVFSNRVWLILISEKNIAGKELASRVELAVAGSMKASYELLKGKRLLSKGEYASVSSLSDKDKFFFVLSMHYPEVKDAFDKYSLKDDAKIKARFEKIDEIVELILNLPEAVAEEVLKAPRFGRFLFYKFSQA